MDLLFFIAVVIGHVRKHVIYMIDDVCVRWKYATLLKVYIKALLLCICISIHRMVFLDTINVSIEIKK